MTLPSGKLTWPTKTVKNEGKECLLINVILLIVAVDDVGAWEKSASEHLLYILGPLVLTVVAHHPNGRSSSFDWSQSPF